MIFTISIVIFIIQLVKIIDRDFQRIFLQNDHERTVLRRPPDFQSVWPPRERLCRIACLIPVCPWFSQFWETSRNSRTRGISPPIGEFDQGRVSHFMHSKAKMTSNRKPCIQFNATLRWIRGMLVIFISCVSRNRLLANTKRFRLGKSILILHKLFRYSRIVYRVFLILAFIEIYRKIIWMNKNGCFNEMTIIVRINCTDFDLENQF